MKLSAHRISVCAGEYLAPGARRAPAGAEMPPPTSCRRCSRGTLIALTPGMTRSGSPVLMCVSLHASGDRRGMFAPDAGKTAGSRGDAGSRAGARRSQGRWRAALGENLFLASYRFERPLTEVYRSTLPYTAIVLGAVLLITYVPGLTLWLVRLAEGYA